MGESERIERAADLLRRRGVGEVDVAMVLGSGLKRFGERVVEATSIAFSELPDWPAPRVEGHGGALVVGRVGAARVACLTGRVHLYEGWSAHEVVRAVRTLRHLGTRRFLLTNAAGGISETLRPGDLMVIRDHLNLTGRSPLLGGAEPLLGPRFPDQTAVYSVALSELLHAVDPDLRSGVYAGNLGPCYETPAEIRMLAAAGADAVGMSTVVEAAALTAMGAEVAGISLISNAAAGLSGQPLSHDEVIETASRAEARLVQLVERFCDRIGSAV